MKSPQQNYIKKAPTSPHYPSHPHLPPPWKKMSGSGPALLAKFPKIHVCVLLSISRRKSRIIRARCFKCINNRRTFICLYMYRGNYHLARLSCTKISSQGLTVFLAHKTQQPRALSVCVHHYDICSYTCTSIQYITFFIIR